MIHVFIDTNIYLNFFHFTDDELKEIRTNYQSPSKKGIYRAIWRDNWLTRPKKPQSRGKARRIAKELRTMKIPDRFPRLVQSYGEYSALREAASEFARQRSVLMEKVEADATARTLAADHQFDDLVACAIFLDDDEAVVIAARAGSSRRGLPPERPALWATPSTGKRYWRGRAMGPT